MATEVSTKWWTKEPAVTLMKVLNNPFDSTRFVGGCVRNTILKMPITDIDVATKHRPREIISLLESAEITVKATGLSHGTVTAFFGGMRFEITTLRKDIKTDGRHAVIKFTDCWKEDAKRRDFTINTLLMDQFGEIIDPLGCKQDILDGRVAFVGCPSKRIQEDALRILRFFRFNAYFGRGLVEQEALNACKTNAHLLSVLSEERIREELFKILASENVCNTLELMQNCSIVEQLFSADIRLSELEALISFEKEKADPLRRLAIAFDAKTKTLASRLKLSNKMSSRLFFLKEMQISKSLDPLSIKSLFYKYGVEEILDLLMVKSALDKDTVKTHLAALEISKDWHKPIFPITGEDVVSLGVAPGVAVGKILAATENWWIANNFKPNCADCVTWARCFIESDKENFNNG